MPGWRFAGLAAILCLVAGCGGEGKEARQYLKAGEEDFQHSDFRGALQHFRKAAEVAPSSAAAQARRGEAAELLGNFDEAIEAYDAAARLAPSAARFFRMGELADQVGDTAAAVEWLKASLAAGPASRSQSHPMLEWLKGTLFPSRVTREEVADRLIQVYVESGDRGAALALARAEGWVKEGLNYCDENLDIASDRTEMLLAMLIHPQKADCLLDLGISLANESAPRLARLVLMDRTQRSQDPEVRERAARALRARLPGHDVEKLAETFNRLGRTLHHRYRKLDDAVAAYGKAIATDPAFSWPYSNMGLVLDARGETALALEWHRKAITVNPNDWRARTSLGGLVFRLKRYDEAVAVFREAVALDPDDAEGHASMGRALLALGREAEGIQALQTALRLDPHLTVAQALLMAKQGKLPPNIRRTRPWYQ